MFRTFTDPQRDEVARMIEQVLAESAEDGESTFSLDAFLDAVQATVLPDEIARYFEAHITFQPDISEMYREKASYELFAETMSELGWRASKFEHDDVDGIAGKWFVSFRSEHYSVIENEVRGMINGLSANGTVERYKIEETLLDSKCGDVL